MWQMHMAHSSKTTLHCIHLKKKRTVICKRATLSLFAQIVQVQQLQSSKRIIIFHVKIYNTFSLNSSCLVYVKLPVCTKNNIYTKINHQLFSARSLRKGRRRACREIIFLATELMHFLWTNQPTKFSYSHHSLSIFHLNLTKLFQYAKKKIIKYAG